MFENRVLRRICGTDRDEVTGDCKKNMIKIFVVCSFHQISLRMIISKRMGWVGHVARIMETVSADKIMVGKREW
jgi:hypothetical protein